MPRRNRADQRTGSPKLEDPGRLAKIEDIVPWVGFLLTDGWRANGQIFFVNGDTTR
ncbi:hypothetical protein [Nonomuraea dietziae]|uniref:hypothetical protein n=1 Tax=Nonomuraea dietziae TaxID=65515 RepID=UPI00344599F5